jgi:biotin carboxyl carrier protein
MFKAKTNNRSEFEIIPVEDGFIVNKELIQWDIISKGAGNFHILFQNKSFRAEIVKADMVSKTVTIKINGRLYNVEVKNKLDLLLEKMGMSQANTGKINHIKAPMPGLIIDLKVKEGDAVSHNDPLLILEAMKMENIIKSPGEGIVKSIKIKKGQSVEKNQILIEF